MGGQYGNKRAIAPEREQEVIELYQREHCTRVVADVLGVSDETIRRILKRNGIPRRKPKREKPKAENPNNKPKGIDREQVKELFQAGLSISAIARQLGCTDNTIYHHLEKLGLYKVGQRKAENDALAPQIMELHNQGLSTYKIAEQLGIGRYAINERLHKMGVGCNGKKSAPVTLTCKRCGKPFVRQSPNQIYCSKTCNAAVYWMRRNDAKRVGVDEVETITLREVWERDHGRCYLCGRKTDWSDYHIVNGWRVTGPRYPSRDHVIALSNGGTHTRDNIRLACFECNANKNNHGQLRLAV